MNPAEIITTTLGAFTAFLPSVIAVRHHDPNDTRKVSDLRLGLLYGGVLSFGIAFYYSHKSNNPKPLAVWMAAALSITVLYEYSLRHSDDIDLRSSDG